MTFSTETKNALCKVEAETWCCKQSELAALVCFAGAKRKGRIRFAIENKNIADRICALIREVTLTKVVTMEPPQKAGGLFGVVVEAENAQQFLRTVGISDALIPEKAGRQTACCVASFLRGAFLGGGSVADPEKNYHMEFTTAQAKLAEDLMQLLAAQGYLAGMTVRKNHFVVYIKDSEAIAELLGLIGAGLTMMDYYNIKIEREVRNRVNRQLNCDSANIAKTMNAAQRQLAAIAKIERVIGLEALPPQLAQMAQVRMENPELPLSELAGLLSPPIGKSGANHRLAKLIEIGESL